MKKILLLIPVIFIFGCNRDSNKFDYEEVNKQLSAYLKENAPSDWNIDYNYELLKLYTEKDTSFLSKLKEYNTQISELKNRIYERDSINGRFYLKNIREENAEEIYRFTLHRAFVYYNVIITASKINDSIFDLHVVKHVFPEKIYIAKNNAKMGEFFKEINFNKPITASEWDSLIKLINGSLFWSLNTESDEIGLDGSFWSIEGTRMSYNYKPTKTKEYHYVTRFSPENGTYKDIGLYLMKLSGNDFGRIY